jgi:hypothetical protein
MYILPTDQSEYILELYFSTVHIYIHIITLYYLIIHLQFSSGTDQSDPVELHILY